MVPSVTSARRRGHPHLVAQAGDAHGSLILRARVVDGQHHHQGFLEQDLPPDAGGSGARLGDVLVTDDEVQTAEAKLRNGRLELDLGEFELDAGLFDQQVGEGRDEEVAQGGLHPAGADGATNVPGQGGQVHTCRFGRRQEEASVVSEEASGIGEPDSAPSPLHQGRAGFPLQHRHLLGDRGW